MDLVFLLLGAALLLGALGLGYRAWVWPRSATLSREGQALLLLVLLTLAGGAIGAPFWWLDKRQSFSWDLPPLASRMLAAAAVSYAVAAAMTLPQPTRPRLRLLMILLFVYLAPLAALIPFFYSGRFDFSEPITWSFFLIVVVMTASSLYFFLVTPAIEGDEENPPRGYVEQAWLLALVVLLGAWGAALVVTDHGFSKSIWLWPGDGLTSSLIGVMLLAIAAGSAWSLRSLDAARVMLAFSAVYGAGATAANLWNKVQDKPVKTLYIVVFAVIAAVSAGLLAAQSRRRTPGSAGQMESEPRASA